MSAVMYAVHLTTPVLPQQEAATIQLYETGRPRKTLSRAYNCMHKAKERQEVAVKWIMLGANMGRRTVVYANRPEILKDLEVCLKQFGLRTGRLYGSEIGRHYGPHIDYPKLATFDVVFTMNKYSPFEQGFNTIVFMTPPLDYMWFWRLSAVERKDFLITELVDADAVLQKEYKFRKNGHGKHRSGVRVQEVSQDNDLAHPALAQAKARTMIYEEELIRKACRPSRVFNV